MEAMACKGYFKRG